MVWKLMAILLAFKLVAVATSYGSGNAGGIFGPSLFIGAMVGGTLGSVAHHLLPGHTAQPGAYALVGMGALFAGIVRAPMTSVLMIFERTIFAGIHGAARGCALVGMGALFAGVVRAPMTSVVMIFETTRDYAVIVPLMIANLVSFFLSSRLQKEPIYEALAVQDGIHLPGGALSQHRQGQRQVAQVMRPTAKTNWIAAKTPLAKVLWKKGRDKEFRHLPGGRWKNGSSAW